MKSRTSASDQSAECVQDQFAFVGEASFPLFRGAAQKDTELGALKPEFWPLLNPFGPELRLQAPQFCVLLSSKRNYPRVGPSKAVEGRVMFPTILKHPNLIPRICEYAPFQGKEIHRCDGLRMSRWEFPLDDLGEAEVSTRLLRRGGRRAQEIGREE